MSTAENKTGPVKPAPTGQTGNQQASKTETTQPGNVGGGQSIQKPVVFTIKANYKGFPVDVEVEGKAEALDAMINRLQKLGATPHTPPAPIVQIERLAMPGGDNEDTKRRDFKKRIQAPTCPEHNRPTKASRKDGEWFCPAKDRDSRSGYCTFKCDDEGNELG